MKMMIALRGMRTPITPMMKSAAVRASDSASTDCSPSSEYHGADDGDEQQHARQFERQQVVLEQWRRDCSDGVQLLQLLLVEIAWHNQLLWQVLPQDDRYLAQHA